MGDFFRSLGQWAPSPGQYNLSVLVLLTRRNWGCATSRGFREVACPHHATIDFALRLRALVSSF